MLKSVRLRGKVGSSRAKVRNLGIAKLRTLPKVEVELLVRQLEDAWAHGTEHR